jgi:hypothetical protein
MVDSKKSQKLWHVAFGEVLENLFPPLNIEVLTEVQIMNKSPKVDILLLDIQHAAWTTEQLQRLPDGIRQCKARQILLEFKFTESVNEDAFIQARSYDHFYKKSQNLTDKQAQTFIVSAKKTWQKTRETWGYENMVYQGVYESHNECLKKIPLISLNELSADSHNAYFKLFASHKKEREKAFNILEREGLPLMPEPLESLLSGLRLLTGEQDMSLELTPEQVRNMGRNWGKRYLETIPLKERLTGANPVDVITQLKPKPGERLAGLSADEIEELEFQLKKLKQQKH